MPETPKESFVGLNAVEEAEARAFRRGAKQAELEGTLKNHFAEDDRRFAELQRGQEHIGTEVTEVKETLQEVREQMKRKDVVAETLARATKDAAEKSVSTRTFIVTMVGAVGALSGLLGATGHL